MRLLTFLFRATLAQPFEVLTREDIDSCHSATPRKSVHYYGH
jgi:hypothetical protein